MITLVLPIIHYGLCIWMLTGKAIMATRQHGYPKCIEATELSLSLFFLNLKKQALTKFQFFYMLKLIHYNTSSMILVSSIPNLMFLQLQLHLGHNNCHSTWCGPHRITPTLLVVHKYFVVAVGAAATAAIAIIICYVDLK